LPYCMTLMSACLALVLDQARKLPEPQPSQRSERVGEVAAVSGLAARFQRDIGTPELQSKTRSERLRSLWSSAPSRLDGVAQMMTCISALQTIAAQRGEGLRPELVCLLERQRRQYRGDSCDAAERHAEHLEEASRSEARPRRS